MQTRRLELTGLANSGETRGLTGKGLGLAPHEAAARDVARFLNRTESFFWSTPWPLAGYPDLLLTLPQINITPGIECFNLLGNGLSCQVNYNPTRDNGFGLMVGEELEQLWLYIQHLIWSGRVSSSLRKLQKLDSHLLYLAQKMREKMWFNLLMKMEKDGWDTKGGVGWSGKNHRKVHFEQDRWRELLRAREHDYQRIPGEWVSQASAVLQNVHVWMISDQQYQCWQRYQKPGTSPYI